MGCLLFSRPLPDSELSFWYINISLVGGSISGSTAFVNIINQTVYRIDSLF